MFTLGVMVDVLAAAPDDGPDADRPDADVVGVVDGGDAATALLQPTRLRILQALARPDTAAGLARRLGEPRQRLGHHLRLLEEVGLVELVAERRNGNMTERVLRASARAYVVDPAVLGPVAADPTGFRGRRELPVSYLLAVLTRGVRELARLRRLAAGVGKRLPVLTVDAEVTFPTPEAQARFTDDLADAVSTVVARHSAPDAPQGRTFRLVVGAYPLPPEAGEAPPTAGDPPEDVS